MDKIELISGTTSQILVLYSKRNNPLNGQQMPKPQKERESQSLPLCSPQARKIQKQTKTTFHFLRHLPQGGLGQRGVRERHARLFLILIPILR